MVISTGDKNLRDKIGLCEWDEDTYECVMRVVRNMLKLKGYNFDELDDTTITIEVEFEA